MRKKGAAEATPFFISSVERSIVLEECRHEVRIAAFAAFRTWTAVSAVATGTAITASTTVTTWATITVAAAAAAVTAWAAIATWATITTFTGFARRTGIFELGTGFLVNNAH